MNLHGRLKLLERAAKANGTCSECHGVGKCTVSTPEPGEEVPKGGCPACGAGLHLVILRHGDMRQPDSTLKDKKPGVAL